MRGTTPLIRLVVGPTVTLVLVGVLTLAGPPAFAANSSAAATAPWVQLADPYPSPASASEIATFGDAGVAVVGDGDTIAVSIDGGATWTQRALPGGAPVQAVAFSDANHGWAVGPADTIDVTSNGGTTWQAVNVTGNFDAIAAATSARLVCALSLSPSLIVTAINLTTPTWTAEATTLTSYPTAPTSIVAGPGGFAAATGANGALVTRGSDGTWAAQTTFLNPVVLAMTSTPVWGNGTPQLFAVGARDIQGSGDEGATFAPLPAPPVATLNAVTQLSATVLRAPEPQLLVGGQSGLLERFVLSNNTWKSDAGPLTGAIVSCAAGPGGVAYALSSDGHIERTLSYGAAPLSLKTSTTKVTASNDVLLTASSSCRAPGTLTLDERPAGGAWKAIRTWPWSSQPASDCVVRLAPLSTTQYRARFVFAGHSAARSAAVTVGVRPRISLAYTSLHLRRGAIYRLTGKVFPAERGRKVTIWTNRGGTWHKITGGAVVALVQGSSFATRLFGTPISESYKLQVRMAGNASYLAAKSALVNVTIK